MDTWSIKPTPQRAGRVELCGLDMSGSRYCESVAVFGPSLNVERFREALARSLELYPFLAGTLTQEGKRLFLDMDGPGVQFAYEESTEPCPRWGKDVLQLNVRHLFLPTPWRERTSPDPSWRVFGRPLLFVKLTRFADGRYVLGSSLCHTASDGRGATRWFADVNRLYCGEEITDPPVFERESLRALGDPNAEGPDPASGFMLARPFAPGASREDIRFEPDYTYFPLPDEQRGMLVSVAAKDPALGISAHDLLHALLLKSFAHSSPMTMTHVALAQPYDARQVKGLGFPVHYVGNGTLNRLVRVPRAEVIDAPFADLAARLAETVRPTAAQARQDIGVKQREYAAGHVDDFGNFTSMQPNLGRDTLAVNNMAHSSPSQQPLFEGSLLWTDLAINQPMVLRSAWIFGNSSRPESHRIWVVLPKEQIDAFRVAWEKGMEELAASMRTTRMTAHTHTG